MRSQNSVQFLTKAKLPEFYLQCVRILSAVIELALFSPIQFMNTHICNVVDQLISDCLFSRIHDVVLRLISSWNQTLFTVQKVGIR